MGAGSPESIRKVAAQGYNLLLDQYASIAEIGQRIALFKGEVERHGRTFDPLSVAVTRSINVISTPAELQKAFENRIAARRRIDRLTLRPDGRNQQRVISDEAICAGALYGSPDEIAVKLQALRDVGAEYVLLNSAGGPASLRRFAHEVRPAFADAPTLQPV
jgi:alkanesulfonate monooxygenase SsuD/methylene tetrahydromethanopterin reductase-like flavin-dependent oxidoreductase (luciferase family)